MAGKRREPPAANDTPDKPTPPPVAFRVCAIRKLMQSGEWRERGAELTTELSAEWGVGVATVQHDAAEASRQLEAMLSEGGAVRGELVGLLLEAADFARLGAPDVAKALVAVAKQASEIAGFGVHRRAENNPKPAPEPLPPNRIPFGHKPAKKDQPS